MQGMVRFRAELKCKEYTEFEKNRKCQDWADLERTLVIYFKITAFSVVMI